MKYPVISAFFLIVAGCGIISTPQPTSMHDFGLLNSSPSSKLTKLTNQQPSISVEAPKWLMDNRIHYRLLYSNPTQVRFYALDRWIAPPSELFEQLLRANGKGWFLPIIVRLNVFEQQFVSSTQAKVVMQFTVTTNQDEKNHQAINQDFHLQIPCPTPDAKGAVTGFTYVTKEASEKISAWLVETQ
jgi:cholesterol transport system auxiliary component